jgi:3-oxoacyl-[acyl-carrier-protein] synthase II
MLNGRRIVVTGLGVISSIGIGWQEFWENLLQGKSGISPVVSVDTSGHFTHNGGEAKNFKAGDFIPRERLPFMNRATQMAMASTHLALRDAGLAPGEITDQKVGVSHGTTFGAIQTIENINDALLLKQALDTRISAQLPTHSVPSALARELKLSGPNWMIATACAAGNYAVGYGYDLIRLKRADMMVVGASDPFSRIAFTGFNQFKAVAPEKCQPFDKNRKGIMVAEGAGSLILESLEKAQKRNAPIYGEVVGYGLSCDAYHMTTSSVEGISECMRKALTEAGLTTEDVDYISAHGTGTPTNDKNECAAIKEVFGDRHKTIPVSSIKSMLGHAMGAASALEAIVCVLAVKTDTLPPTINFETPDPECDIDCVPNQSRKHKVNVALNNSYAFGGNNASVVFKKFIS